MSYTPVAFESAWKKAEIRQDIRDARQKVLDKAADEYERREMQKERARQRGDDKWMLPSVEETLAHSSSKKHKKHKKHKKKKKKHSKKSSSSESQSEDEWEEKAKDKTKEEKTEPIQQRDDWMNMQSLIPCITKDDLREKIKKDKEKHASEIKKNLLDQPGQSTRELNPYWKDGGAGVPEKEPTAKHDVKLSNKTVGDQGVGWLKKALKRIHEQASETGVNAEEIARERWGSLEKLENLIAEAEGRKEEKHKKFGDSERNRSHYYGRNKCQEYDKNRDSRRRSPDRRRTSSDTRRRTPERKRRSPDRRHRSPDRSPEDKRKSHEEIKAKFVKPSMDEDDIFTYKSKSTASTSKGWKKPEATKTPEKHKKKRKPSTSSSSSSSSSEEEKQETEEPIKLLSDKEMNDIGARIVKAEILGNEELAKELKEKLESARTLREEAKNKPTNDKKEKELVILTRTNVRGVTRPVNAPAPSEPQSGRRNKKQKVETHNKSGERERYFADDDNHRLQDMFTNEKLNTVEDSNYEFARLIGKGAKRLESGQGDLDDMFEEKVRYKESDSKLQQRERSNAVNEQQRVIRALEGCKYCVGSKQMLKHLIVALGSKVYLSVPSYRSLTEGHCLIAPTMHATCATQLDEDVWEEMQMFRKALTKMFADREQDCVFFETAKNLKKFPHMVIECVPLDLDSGGLAPIYFKKAIQECETEWSTNKKLVELAGKGVRKSIPKGLPYFSVCFGNEDGFAHVIEDENLFPQNFAQETIGGILDLDHHLWRKKQNENFDMQRKKVIEFAQMWEPYNFTKKKDQSSSSSSSDSD